MTSTRIYVVTGSEKPRLVRASSQAQAVGHVVRKQFRASVATQAELVQILTDGAKVEQASDSE